MSFPKPLVVSKTIYSKVHQVRVANRSQVAMNCGKTWPVTDVKALTLDGAETIPAYFLCNLCFKKESKKNAAT